MLSQAKASLLSTLLLLSLSTPTLSRPTTSEPSTPPPSHATAANATYDGKCFYPAPDPTFSLQTYLGAWYQVAGTSVPFTAGCRCTRAVYTAEANGTVGVYNTCQMGERAMNIRGTAAPVHPSFGRDGVFKVKFPFGSVDQCPGPNYIVQVYSPDRQWAIVQASNFSTLFVLTRNPTPPTTDIDAWVAKAGSLGTNLNNVIRFNQTGCTYPA